MGSRGGRSLLQAPSLTISVEPSKEAKSARDRRAPLPLDDGAEADCKGKQAWWDN